MRKSYDFSKGIRGKFYRDNVKLMLPIYLDADVADLVKKAAKRRRVDAQTVLNRILRSNKQLLE
jgi:hypothetical protein